MSLERLIFISMDMLRAEVKDFVPTEDVLFLRAQKAAPKAENPDQPGTEAQGQIEDAEVIDQYANWYPPMRSTLVSLTKLYLCLDV